MGVVYKALDPLLERVVALKTMSAHLDSEPELRARFFREGRSAAHLSHKNIITIYDLGEEGGTAYMAMEYLEGVDLKAKILGKEQLSLRRKVEIMAEVCEGLAHAHARQVIHRDIKPGNIFITKSGHVKILDFGLARVISSDITRSGVAVGTPNYMSPEQVRGDKVDHRTDIFSAGALFYEILSSRKPFEADSFTATVIKILHDDPEPLEKLDPSTPSDLAAIVSKALAKDLDARYQSVRELLQDLRGFCASLPPEVTGAPEDEMEQTAALGGDVSPDSIVTAEIPVIPSPSRGFQPIRIRTEISGSRREPQAEVAISGRSPERATKRSPGPYLVVVALVLAFVAWGVWSITRQRGAGISQSVPPVASKEPSAVTHSPADAGQSGSKTAVGPAAPDVVKELARANAKFRANQFEEAAREAQEILDRFPDNLDAQDILRLSRERTNTIAKGTEKTRSLIQEGKYQEASSRLGEVLRIAPSNPEAKHLAAQLNTYAGKNAAEAMGLMAEAKRHAESAGAPQLVPRTLAAAQSSEVEARQLFEAQRFGEAAAKFFETSGLYRSASIEAIAEKEAQANRARLAELERQKNQVRNQAEVSRRSFEGDRGNALKAAADARAAEKYQEAVKLALQAQSKWEREDYNGARNDFEAASILMQQAADAALEVARRADSEAPPKPAPPASPAPPLETDRQAISAAIQQYAAALRARDISMLKSIWPVLGGVQERAIREEFKNARSIQVELKGLDIKINGESATASARRTYVLQTVDGHKLQTETKIVISFYRTGGTWAIQAIRFEPFN